MEQIQSILNPVCKVSLQRLNSAFKEAQSETTVDKMVTFVQCPSVNNDIDYVHTYTTNQVLKYPILVLTNHLISRFKVRIDS
jgi:hypothetical protein